MLQAAVGLELLHPATGVAVALNIPEPVSSTPRSASGSRAAARAPPRSAAPGGSSCADARLFMRRRATNAPHHGRRCAEGGALRDARAGAGALRGDAARGGGRLGGGALAHATPRKQGGRACAAPLAQPLTGPLRPFRKVERPAEGEGSPPWERSPAGAASDEPASESSESSVSTEA